MKMKRTEKGQSLVEFAISLIIIMTLLAGAVEFGIALFQFVQLRDAAQEGALYGSMNPDDTAGIRWRVRAASQSPIDLSNTTLVPDADISVTTTASPPCEGDGVTVSIKFNHHISLPLVGPIIGSTTIPLTASVTDTILLSGAGCP